MLMDTNGVQKLIVCVIVALLTFVGCAGFLLKPRQHTPLQTAINDAKMSGGTLSTNSVVFECDFWNSQSAKVYYFQHNGKDHYVAIGRNGGIAIK